MSDHKVKVVFRVAGRRWGWMHETEPEYVTPGDSLLPWLRKCADEVETTWRELHRAVHQLLDLEAPSLANPCDGTPTVSEVVVGREEDYVATVIIDRVGVADPRAESKETTKPGREGGHNTNPKGR